jgi:hypothetical protein
MTADDQRYTLRQAADLTDKSADRLRRWTKNGKLPGAGSDADDAAASRPGALTRRARGWPSRPPGR